MHPPNPTRWSVSLALTLASLAAAQGQGLVIQNGIDTYVDVPYDPTVIPKSGITLEAWVT